MIQFGFNPVIPSYSESLKGLSEPFTYLRDLKDKQAQLAEYRRQNDLNAYREGAKEARERREFAVKNADRNKGTFKEIADLVRQGRTSEAQALAASSEYVDPDTGEMKSIKFDKGGERLDPNFKPLQLQMPEEQPKQPPDLSGYAATFPLGQARLKSTTILGNKPEGPDLSGFAERFQLKPPPEQVTPGGPGFGYRKVNPSLTTPSGQTVEFDPAEAERYKQQQNEEQRKRLLALAEDPTLPPDLRRTVMLRAGLTGAGASGAEGAQIMNRESQEDTQAQSTADKARYELTAPQKFQIGMRPRGTGGASKPITPGQKADDERADASLASNMLNQQLQREDYKPTIVALRETKVLLDGLESDNPAMQRRSLGIWAKQASGPGAVQQSERDEFVNVVGGKDEALRKAAAQWLDGGRVPEEQRKIFSAAARDIIIRRQMETLQGIQSDTRDMFASHPNPTMNRYADWAAGRVGQQFLPKSAGGPAAKQGAAPSAGGTPAKPQPAPAAPSAGGVVIIKKGPYAGRRARVKGNGKFELLD